MNAFQDFLAKLPCHFLTDETLPELIRLHRLCWCLVRLGGAGGRFSAPAQNVAQLMKYCEAGGDYVRDVSVCSFEVERAHKWQPELTPPAGSPSLPKCKQCGVLYMKHNLCGCLYCPKCWLSCPRCGGIRREDEKPKTVLLSDSVMFNEADCGGVFDGRQVTSDADPGL